jgi:DNA-binding NtrC family response regulator
MSKTVLIAENDGIISLDLQTLFKDKFYKPVIFKTGEDLLEYYRFNKADLIIADLMLGRKSDENILLEINNIDHTPVILISGSAKSKLDKFTKNLSLCSYLVKPFDKSELIKLIDKYLAINK